jgi:hypothetical protein
MYSKTTGRRAQVQPFDNLLKPTEPPSYQRWHFLRCIVTGDKTRIHHYASESRCQGIEWKNLILPVENEFKTPPLARKVILTLWGGGGRMYRGNLQHYQDEHNSKQYLCFMTALGPVETRCCHGGLGSKSGLVMWDLWWTKWCWGRFSLCTAGRSQW